MSASNRVAMSAFIGALAGYLASLTVHTALFSWWLAAVLGAAMGAFVSAGVYAWPELKAAAPEAYRAARGWRPDKAYWRDVASVAWAWAWLAVGIAAPFCCIAIVASYLTGEFSAPAVYLAVSVVIGIFVAPLALIVWNILLLTYYEREAQHNITQETWKGGIAELAKSVRKNRVARRFNPFMMCFVWPPYGLYCGIKAAVIGLPGFIFFARNFGKELGVRVYSDGLKIAAFWAAIGAFAAFATGYPLVSATVAAVSARVSYKLISVRFGLVPNGNSA